MSDPFKPEHVPDQMNTIIRSLRRLGLEALSIAVEDDYELEPESFTPDYIEALAGDVARVAVAIINEGGVRQ